MVADALLFSDTSVAARCRLPAVLAQLLLAQQILAGNYLRPAGGFFLECFAGTSVFTLGVMFAHVPCICPWDVVFGPLFDCLRNERVLMSLISLGYISMLHFGTPCQSMTYARLPQLRDHHNIWGRPGISKAQQA